LKGVIKMDEERIIKNAYGSIDLPNTNMYTSVIEQLSGTKHRRRIKLRPMALIIIISLALGGTAIAATATSQYLTRNFPPFYTEDGEYVDPMANYEYAQKINEASGGAQPYFTREQIKQLLDDGVTMNNSTNIRQPHIIPEPLFAPGEVGSDVPLDLCDNTFYFLYDGRRACNQCGYIFTEEQDREIGLID
jgi:hypothetical protein